MRRRIYVADAEKVRGVYLETMYITDTTNGRAIILVEGSRPSTSRLLRLPRGD